MAIREDPPTRSMRAIGKHRAAKVVLRDRPPNALPLLLAGLVKAAARRLAAESSRHQYRRRQLLILGPQRGDQRR